MTALRTLNLHGCQLGKTEDGFAINQYFVDHPEMVLGVLSTESTQYGREELTVAPLEGIRPCRPAC